MANTFTSLHYHVVFSTKGREPWLRLDMQALKRIKGGSSGWIKQNIRGCRGFGWQDGYGAFTVSKSQDARVKAYISKQRQHHRKENFQEEYRALLDRHEIEYDERYLWD
jgi:REP element-mobilizing transposase RayT